MFLFCLLFLIMTFFFFTHIWSSYYPKLVSLLTNDSTHKIMHEIKRKGFIRLTSLICLSRDGKLKIKEPLSKTRTWLHVIGDARCTRTCPHTDAHSSLVLLKGSVSSCGTDRHSWLLSATRSGQSGALMHVWSPPLGLTEGPLNSRMGVCFCQNTNLKCPARPYVRWL